MPETLAARGAMSWRRAVSTREREPTPFYGTNCLRRCRLGALAVAAQRKDKDGNPLPPRTVGDGQ